MISKFKYFFKLLITFIVIVFGMSFLTTFLFSNFPKKEYTNSLSSKSQLVETRNTNSYYYARTGIETLANASGPLVLSSSQKDVDKKPNLLINYDWYGNPNWTLDVSVIDKNSNEIIDIDIMQNHNWIYVLTNNSFIIKLHSITGEILGRKNLKDVINESLPTGGEYLVDKIGSILFNDFLYAWNSTIASTRIFQIDRNTLEVNKRFTSSSKEYLVDIFPIYVGYNIGVFTSGAAPNVNQNVGSLILRFVDDNMNTINGPTDVNVDLSSLNVKYVDLPKYVFNRTVYTNNNSILLLGNKIFNVKLEKTLMSNSEIKELHWDDNNGNFTPNTSSGSLNLKQFNSAFSDSRDTVYFKEKDGSKIYSLDFNNKLTIFYDLLGNSSSNAVKEIVGTNTNGTWNVKDNQMQIFGVIDNSIEIDTQSKSTRNLANSLFLSTPDKEYSTVIKDSRLDFTNFTSLKSSLKIKSTKIKQFKENVPSVIDFTYFEVNGADKLLAENITFKANDLRGELDVKAIATKKAWYTNNQSVKTIIIFNKSYVNGRGNEYNQKISNQVTWATQSTFKNWFGKYTPDQLVESDLEKHANLISIKNSSTFRNLTKKIAIINRNGSTGAIKLSGVISYTDRHYNYVNFPIPPQEYTIAKSTGKYSFRFVGASQDNEGIKNGETLDETNKPDVINMDNITDDDVKYLSRYVPSLINPDDYSLFIEKEESYIPSRRVIMRNANDEDGTLTLTVVYNGMNPSIPYRFEQTYSGFQTFKTAAVTFEGNETHQYDEIFKPSGSSEIKPHDNKILDITSIPNYHFLKDKVANEVEADQLGEIYKTNLSKMGFMPSISIETLTSNDLEYGSFVVTLDFGGEGENKLKLPYKDKFGLTDYKISQRYVGMLPVSELFDVSLSQNGSWKIIEKYNVNANIPSEALEEALSLKGYEPGVEKLNPEGQIVEDSLSINTGEWIGEKFKFNVTAQSGQYLSVRTSKTLVIDWAPKFAKKRMQSLIAAIVASILGVALVATIITIFVIRRTRIRRMLK